MKVSIISYAFVRMMQAGKVDIFGYLETVKYRFGLEAADIWNFMLTSLDKDYLAKVKEGLCERELVLANLACDRCHVWEDDPDLRAQMNASAWAHIEAGEYLGAKTIRIDAGGARENMAWTNEQFDYIAEMFRKYAQRAYDNGYKIGPENHWGPEDVPENMVKLCQAVDSPAFGVLLHIGRWRGANAAKGDEMVAPCVMHAHVTPSTPEAELPAKLAMLRDAGFKGYYSAELVSERYSELGLQIARIRNVLDSWRLEGK